MADYIYLLENRLAPGQRAALRVVRDVARSNNLTVFLVGGAVRDLTSGSPVRDLDVVVQGNALKLKTELEQSGATITGELLDGQSLFATFEGGVRVEMGSTLSVSWPEPGKPVYQHATILEDLRRRDFTANAMALSLNEGSYGLLMDPMNGIADIENRELRLVSNYGFIEDPIRMVRAARLMARLGWTLDEKTQQRYDDGKSENYIAALSEQQRGYELEEIVHEEDPLRVLTRLESEGWLQILAPFWNASKVDVAALEQLREVQTQLQMQGIHPAASAANFPLLTAKLNAKDVATLKQSFVRQGFVREIESLEQKAKELASLLSSKAAASPSQAWQVITSAAPDALLWVAFSSKSPSIQAKFKNFFTVWPQAKQKLPYALMQEMRIVPDLPIYEELLQKLFFELMDEKLQTVEELKAYLEPYSPPAPPPPVSTRRPRAAKKDVKGKGRAKKAPALDLDEDSEEDGDGELPDEIDEAGSDAADDEDSELEASDSSTSDDENEGEQEEESVPRTKSQGKGAAHAAEDTKEPTAVLPRSSMGKKSKPQSHEMEPLEKGEVARTPAISEVLPKALVGKTPAAKTASHSAAPAKAAKAEFASNPSSKLSPDTAKAGKASVVVAPPASKVSTKPALKGTAKAPNAATGKTSGLPQAKIAPASTPPKKSTSLKATPQKVTSPTKAASKKTVPAKKSVASKARR